MRARAGRDQEGRDCVFRICLELQEAPTTKRFDFLPIFLKLGFSRVYFRFIPLGQRCGETLAKDIFFITFNSPASSDNP